MLHLRVLGRLDLDDDGGRDLSALLAQPKRIALLAYLCVREPGSFCRRDTLLAVFWPESDEERARTALRGALHFLRRVLGPDVIRARGDGDVGVDPARLTCDAAELVAAAAAGRLEDVLALHRGDLLEGLFVADAPAFERWVEEERAHLRRLALDAAATLTADGEARGDLAAALRAARRAAELGPDDETAARRLLGLLDRAGDRAGAIRAYEELAARLATELEAAPAPETRALIEAIRSREASGDAGPVATRRALASYAPPAPRATNGVAPDASLVAAPVVAAPVVAPPRVARSRRATIAALAAALVVALAAGGAWLAGSSRAASAPSMDVLAVLPFTYPRGSDLAYLGAGLPRLLGANLNGAGQLRTIDPVALERAAGGGDRLADIRVARAAARRLGAGLVVSGQVLESGDRVRITADVARIDERGEMSAAEQIVADGRRDSVFALVDDLTARLVDAWGTTRGQRITSVAARTTRSLPALRAYLEGEREYAAGRYTAAVEAFQRAVAADSGFALAYYRLSSALTWTSSPRTMEATSSARRFIGRLSRRDSLLVEARFANSSGHPLVAEELYEAVLADYPDELEAWLQLGEVRYHWGSLLGRPSRLAEPAFARVLALDSTSVPALVHLARIAASVGDGRRLDSLVARVGLLAPGTTEALEVDGLRAFAHGTAAERARATAGYVARGTDVVRSVQPVAASTGNAAAALGVLRVADQVQRDPRLRVTGNVFAAELEVARGRWRAARGALDRLAEAAPLLGAQYRAALAALPFLRVAPAELAAAREGVERARAIASTYPLASVVDSGAGLFASRRAYLLGRLAVRAGDSAAAWRAVAAFRPVTPVEVADTGRVARRVRAEWAWRRGDAPAALLALGAPQLPLDTLLPRFASFASADERFLRAELLAAAGRDEEALRWYETFPDPGGYDLHYLAPALLGRARIHERRGERARAAALYRRFAEQWADCDPELRPLADEARRRADALAAR